MTCFTCRFHSVMAAGHPAEERARPLLGGQIRVQPLVRWAVTHPQLHLQKRWGILECWQQPGVLCVFKKLVSLLQVRWPTGASFWRAKPTKRTARPTGLLSPSLGRWPIRIPAKTSSPGNGKKKKSRLTSVPSNQSQSTDKGVCRQSIYAPLQRHPGLHRQQLDQYHSLWQGLLRQLRDQLH